MNKTTQERVLDVLFKRDYDEIPFTIYEGKVDADLYDGLKNKGCCYVRRTGSTGIRFPNVKTKSVSQVVNGEKISVRTYETPYGTLTSKNKPAGFTTWHIEYAFKTKEDYKALQFIFDDAVVISNLDKVKKEYENVPDYCVLRDNIPLEPLQYIISGGFMDSTTFCIEWMDNRDEILKLYNKRVEFNRKCYGIAADSPIEFVNYGGNVEPRIIGPETFKKYYMPHYNEAAEILHKKGKLIGTHLDSDNTIIMNDIGDTELDYIEAYDPGISPPVKKAFSSFKDKVIWINWPSACHLLNEEGIYNKTIEIMSEKGKKDSLIIGITEDVPEDRHKLVYKTILKAVNDFSKK